MQAKTTDELATAVFQRLKLSHRRVDRDVLVFLAKGTNALWMELERRHMKDARKPSALRRVQMRLRELGMHYGDPRRARIRVLVGALAAAHLS